MIHLQPHTPTISPLFLTFSTSFSDNAFACLAEVAVAKIMEFAKDEIFSTLITFILCAFRSSKELIQRVWSDFFFKLFFDFSFKVYDKKSFFS